MLIPGPKPPSLAKHTARTRATAFAARSAVFPPWPGLTWQCDGDGCGYSWDTFATRGVCPRCHCEWSPTGPRAYARTGKGWFSTTHSPEAPSEPLHLMARHDDCAGNRAGADSPDPQQPANPSSDEVERPPRQHHEHAGHKPRIAAAERYSSLSGPVLESEIDAQPHARVEHRE